MNRQVVFCALIGMCSFAGPVQADDGDKIGWPPPHMKDLPADYQERQRRALERQLESIGKLRPDGKPVLWVRFGIAALALGRHADRINHYMEDDRFEYKPSDKFGLDADRPSRIADNVEQRTRFVRSKPDAPKKPNILFIMSDDHTTQAIGVYGSRLAKLNPTPTIDALAKNGIRFDRVYCNNSICTPSRASILTGQYSQRNGVLDLRGKLPPEKQYLPREMSKAGYHTAMIGKWHLKEEPATFDYYCVLPGQGKYFDPLFRVRGPKPWTKNTIKRQGKHSSDAITDLSIEWLSKGWEREKPFFLMHHFKAPHDMFLHAPRYDSYLQDVEIPEPGNMRRLPPSGLGSGLTKGHEPWMLGKRLNVDQSLEEPEYSRQVYQAYLKRYLRCVKGVDDNVRRLTDYLRQIGELDNTVIIYTGDQGFFLGEHDLMDKRWMYEEAFRMPFIVHAAGIVKQPGSANDWLINNTDFAPTILELAGRQAPKQMQGRSLVAALTGKDKPDDWRTSLYYRYWMHMAHRLAVPAHFGLRTDRHKLIFLYGVDYASQTRTPASWEFYDLQADPFENENQYGNPRYGDIINTMKTDLKQLRVELDETDDAYPEIQAVIDAHWNDNVHP